MTRQPSTITLTEGGKEEGTWTLSQLGYTVDQSKLLAGLQDALKKQRASIPILLDGIMNGNEFTLDMVTAASLKDPRVENANAELVYDEGTKTYSIKPEVQGTQLDDGDIQKLVKTEAEKLVTSAKPAGDVSVEIPSDLYKKPDVLSTDETLNLQMNTYNAYDQAVITYDFGTQKEVLDWNTISGRRRKCWTGIPSRTGCSSRTDREC